MKKHRKKRKVSLTKKKRKVSLTKKKRKVSLTKKKRKISLAKKKRKISLAKKKRKARLAKKKPNYREELWKRRFAELEAYRRRHGHFQVKSRSKKYVALGNWVQYQRVLKRSKRLSAAHTRLLKQSGFDWASRGRSVEFRDSNYWDKKWERELARLVRFKRRFGHCLVPTRWPGTPKLSHWVARQRLLKQEGLLNKDRQRKLETLGIDWRSSATPRWERCFLRLLEFRRRFGHCHVPAEWAENINMGRWVVKTRRLKRAGRLSAEKVRRLDEIGFVWDALGKRQVEHDVIWSEWLDRLIAFRHEYGHWRVPTDQQKFHRLRVWMDNQRITYQHGWLSPDRIRRLEEIEFPWLSDKGAALAADARRR